MDTTANVINRVEVETTNLYLITVMMLGIFILLIINAFIEAYKLHKNYGSRADHLETI